MKDNKGRNGTVILKPGTWVLTEPIIFGHGKTVIRGVTYTRPGKKRMAQTSGPTKRGIR